MKNAQIAKKIAWIAKVWSAFSVAFLVFMLIGHLFGTEDTPLSGFKNMQEFLLFICFPLSTLVGLILAWRWHGLGGAIVVAGILGFHIIGNDLFLIPWIDGLAFPGLLFLIAAIFSGGNKQLSVAN